MFYDRQVKYFDYLVKGERCGNAGFVKLEARGEVCNIQINVNGLEKTDSDPVKVYIVSGENKCELCDLEMAQGKGMTQLRGLSTDNLAGTGLSYEELEGVRIVLSPEREVNAFWGKKRGQENRPKELMEAAQERNESANQESVTDTVAAEAVVPEKRTIVDLEKEEAEQKEHPRNEPENKEKQVTLHDEKWKQLWEIYPHIRPFRDGREYLSVGPGDFVVLPEKYYRLVNNSFLLHGYYNYKHLVLKKTEHRGETRYYIGVPGNYYDREKQVAVMFGFESFEGMEDAAVMGDFGYYLMGIEL